MRLFIIKPGVSIWRHRLLQAVCKEKLPNRLVLMKSQRNSANHKKEESLREFRMYRAHTVDKQANQVSCIFDDLLYSKKHLGLERGAQGLVHKENHTSGPFPGWGFCSEVVCGEVGPCPTSSSLPCGFSIFCG